MLRASAPLVLSSTWANKPSSAAASGLYLFTDVGSSGTLMRYANGRWRPLAGQAQLASLGAAVTGIANSETIVLQTLIPAGAWQVNDTLRLWLVVDKSGTADTANLTVRIGTSGTTADTAITGLSAFIFQSASGLTGGGIVDVKLLSATSARKMGSNNTAGTTYASTSAPSASAVATTITDSSANALYVSVGLASSGATNTVSVPSASIQMITP